jgi:hypothetical protein
VKKIFKLLLIGGVFASLQCYQSWAATSQRNSALLSQEQVQVYRDFMSSLSKMEFKAVSNQTFLVDFASLGKDAACLRGLDLDSNSQVVHLLPREVIQGHSIQLVGAREESAILKQRDADIGRGVQSSSTSGASNDPEILALSEIMFDKSHHFAVVKYVFVCGSRCNSGAILVLEKVGARWVSTTRRPCSFAVNSDDPRK